MSETPSVNTQRFPEIRAVVFDLDGTLIDSMPLVMRGFAHAIAPFRPELTMDALFLHLGGPPERVLHDLIGDKTKTAEALQRWESFGHEKGNQVQPFDGMRRLLETLRARGLHLAIWTGRDRQTTEAILAAHALADLFAVVICGDDLPTHKPDPEGLRAILAHLGLKADEALYAGDADADVLGGTEAGVRTVLIRHNRVTENSILNRAWRVVETPVQAYALIQSATHE